MALASRPMFLEEEQRKGNQWYFSRTQIEENSPSSKDGIDWKKESDLRKSYCSFLRQLGAKTKASQTVISAAMVLCHRFFTRRSHAKYDCFRIATYCFILALKDQISSKVVIDVSTHILQMRFNLYDVFDELSLGSKKLVLQVLNFDVNVKNPHECLVDVMGTFENLPERENLGLVAEKFIEAALETTLCLQFRPRQIAAGAVYSSAKFLKIVLRSKCDEEQWICWWHKFGANLMIMEEIFKEMKENYNWEGAAGVSKNNSTIAAITDAKKNIIPKTAVQKQVAFGKRKNIPDTVITSSFHRTKRICTLK